MSRQTTCRRGAQHTPGRYCRACKTLIPRSAGRPVCSDCWGQGYTVSIHVPSDVRERVDCPTCGGWGVRR